eukprot:5917685-Lingulodinium_polyedra.AAC.1
MFIVHYSSLIVHRRCPLCDVPKQSQDHRPQQMQTCECARRLQFAARVRFGHPNLAYKYAYACT